MVCTYSTLFIHHQRQMGITRTRESIRCPVQYLAYTTHSPQISAHLDASRFSRPQRTQYLDLYRLVTNGIAASPSPMPCRSSRTTSSSLKRDRRSDCAGMSACHRYVYLGRSARRCHFFVIRIVHCIHTSTATESQAGNGVSGNSTSAA
jgi:hypothetical protein